MRTFEVWAPLPEKVELVLDGLRIPMERHAGGWWRASAVATAGTDYGFSLDGGKVLPDPRSRRQPHGVHGASRVVDHDDFAWSDARWRGLHLPSAVIYELHVGTFTPAGTFDGAIAKLDHLVDLGIDAVELMPVAAFPGRHGWGYDGVDLWAPHEAYGGPDGLQRLVDACHERGLGVLLDVVYNHLGPDGNYLGQFGPYFTDRYHTPWGDAVNLDGPGSDEVRAFFIDNALMWLRDFHIDGLRLDAVQAIHDRSAVHFLEELAGRVADFSRASGRRHVLIAESDLNDPRLVRPTEAGGYGLDAAWSDDFHHALHVALTGERHGYYADFTGLGDVATALEQVYVYDGRHSRFRARRHGRPATGVDPSRFVGYLQNHDQVGNRARGRRTASILSPGLLRIGATLVLTAPFVPMLFQGQEWGASTPFPYFADHEDPDLAQAVSEGRRAEFSGFGWDSAEVLDPEDPATFRSAVLDWDEPDRSGHSELLQWHRDLIALRKRTPELGPGGAHPVRVTADETARTLLVERGSWAVLANLADAGRRVPTGGRGDVMLTSDDDLDLMREDVVLPPESVVIVRG